MILEAESHLASAPTRVRNLYPHTLSSALLAPYRIHHARHEFHPSSLPMHNTKLIHLTGDEHPPIIHTAIGTQRESTLHTNPDKFQRFGVSAEDRDSAIQSHLCTKCD